MKSSFGLLPQTKRLALLEARASERIWLIGGRHKGALGIDEALLIVRQALYFRPELIQQLNAALRELNRYNRQREETLQYLRAALLTRRVSVVQTTVTKPPRSYRAKRRAPRRVLSVATTPKVEPTWFELQLVDEQGTPIEGACLNARTGGTTCSLQSGADGRVRFESPSAASTGSVELEDIEALREQLRARWSKVRAGEWLPTTKDRTFSGCAPMSVSLFMQKPHTLVLYPAVTLARFSGAIFETNRAFLLPTARLLGLKPLIERGPLTDVMIVGHTDTSGTQDYNESLSLERAKAVLAYLRDDVEAWLEFYKQAHPRRWGATEDRYMLGAILKRDLEAPTNQPVRYFQRTEGLVDDGIIGKNTRRALISRYMSLDGVSLPPDTHVELLGAGEHFPLDATGARLDIAPDDGRSDAADRRVELFLFHDGLGVLPPSPGQTCTADSPEYPQWWERAHRAAEVYEFTETTRSLWIRLDVRSLPQDQAPKAVRLSDSIRCFEETIVPSMLEGRSTIDVEFPRVPTGQRYDIAIATPHEEFHVIAQVEH